MEEEKTKTEEIKRKTSDLVDHVTISWKPITSILAIKLAQKSINLASGAINFVIVCFFSAYSLFLLQVSALRGGWEM